MELKISERHLTHAREERALLGRADHLKAGLCQSAATWLRSRSLRRS
jgi:hypothetical protein